MQVLISKPLPILSYAIQLIKKVNDKIRDSFKTVKKYLQVEATNPVIKQAEEPRPIF